MKREEFEAIIQPVITQIKEFFIQSAGELKNLGIPISSIELIGGGSRIPLFIRTVSEAFALEAQRTLNSSECIARGAGLFSAMNSGLFRMQSYYSLELSPETLICSWKGENEEIQN
jgi:heat shock 70kDa protein 4